MKIAGRLGLLIIGTVIALVIWYGRPVLARALESAGYVSECDAESVSEEQPVNDRALEALTPKGGSDPPVGIDQHAESAAHEVQVPQKAQEGVSRAKADAAERRGVPVQEIGVISVTSVVWRDSSLGCPRPGGMYMQVITPGYRVLLQVGDDTLEYHLAEGQSRPLFCGPVPTGELRGPVDEIAGADPGDLPVK